MPTVLFMLFHINPCQPSQSISIHINPCQSVHAHHPIHSCYSISIHANHDTNPSQPISFRDNTHIPIIHFILFHVILISYLKSINLSNDSFPCMWSNRMWCGMTRVRFSTHAMIMAVSMISRSLLHPKISFLFFFFIYKRRIWINYILCNEVNMNLKKSWDDKCCDMCVWYHIRLYCEWGCDWMWLVMVVCATNRNEEPKD